MPEKVFKRITLVLFFCCANFALAAQSVQPLQAMYKVGEQIVIDYKGGTGATTDWIGIYKSNQMPGAVGSTIWKYIPTKEGKITFDGGLDPGIYDIHLFCCDKYEILASFKNFEIIGTRISTQLKFYRSDDTIQVGLKNVLKGDALTIYNSKDVVDGIPMNNAVALKSFLIESPTPANMVYKTSLSSNLSTAFTAILKNSNNSIETTGFTVRPIPQVPFVISKIGLGSCANQNSPQPLLNIAIKDKIETFVFSGDNLYIDTYDPNIMLQKYNNYLVGREEYQNLRSSVPILATWDDHDYGCCDEDKDYPHKVVSQKMFLDFFNEPIESPRRKQNGIYISHIYGPVGKRIQVILLDTRYFLDNKRPNNGCGKNDYCPWSSPSDTSKTMLGTEQWKWLKSELTKPAELRMIVSSVQFGATYNGWEGWSIFPHERAKMLKLILDLKAEGVFFVSGDIHYSEVSKMKAENGLYPIYDFTTSAINQSWPPEINSNRIPALVYGDPNVGILDVNWDEKSFTYKCLDVNERVRISHKVQFDELKFKPSSVKKNEIPAHRLIKMAGGFEIIMSDLEKYSFELFDNKGSKIENWSSPSNSISKNGLLPGVYRLTIRNEKKRSLIKILVQ